MTLQQKIKDIKSGKLTAEQNLLNFIKKIDKQNKELNIFLNMNHHALESAKEIDSRIKNKKQTGKLTGLCFAVKSNICVKGLIANCASKVLENFVSPFDATVIQKLKNEDAIVIGMANMDEFAAGGSGETSAFNPVKNPLNPKLIPGGSSSGSAAAVAADLCDFSLGSDTGGSIRNPSAFCNTIGLKPTYGSVSRYGLIDLSMSLDQIGPITKTIEDSKLIFDIIKGQDNFDATTKNYSKEQIKPKQKYTIGLVNVEDFSDKKIAELVKSKTEEIAKANKWEIKQINLPLDIAIQTYYLLVYVEFFSATRKFDGRRFGFKIEEKAGHEVLRRIFGGSEISRAEYAGKYYREALKAKAYIKEQFNELFRKADVLILPTVPVLPWKIGESISVKQMYAADVFTVLANLAEIPAISVPVEKHVGLQIMAPKFSEEIIFDVAKRI